MSKLTLWDKFRQAIGNLGWTLFLWGNDITAEKYWDMIYMQEKSRLEHPELFERNPNF
jgi:hypothetical protein